MPYLTLLGFLLFRASFLFLFFLRCRLAFLERLLDRDKYRRENAFPGSISILKIGDSRQSGALTGTPSPCRSSLRSSTPSRSSRRRDSYGTCTVPSPLLHGCTDQYDRIQGKYEWSLEDYPLQVNMAPPAILTKGFWTKRNCFTRLTRKSLDNLHSRTLLRL